MKVINKIIMAAIFGLSGFAATVTATEQEVDEFYESLSPKEKQSLVALENLFTVSESEQQVFSIEQEVDEFYESLSPKEKQNLVAMENLFTVFESDQQESFTDEE